MDNEKLNRISPLFVIAMITFVSMFIFYYTVHPLYIYDVDDWAYMTGVRHALPSVKQWNPTKILPETLMPLVSSLAAWLIYPIEGDYIRSLCMAFALVTASFITLYVVMTAVLIKKKARIQGISLIFVMGVFLLVHFFLYLTEVDANKHFFYTGNVTCIFNYLIPSLWNFILCLYFMTMERTDWQDKNGYIKKGIIVLLVYLAINSNLWHSIILMSYMGIELLFELVSGIYAHKKGRGKFISFSFLRSYAIKNVPRFLALLTWFVSMIFEINGGRANWNTEGRLQIKEAIENFGSSLTQIRKEFLLVIAVINVVAICVAVIRTKQIVGLKTDSAKRFLISQGKKLSVMVLSVIYLILLAAKVSPVYLKNPHVMISWMLWLMLISTLSLVYLIHFEVRICWLLPCVTYILLFEVLIDKKTFAENYSSMQTPSIIKALDDDIIRQVKAAESDGKDSVTVYIPVKGSGGWPIDPGMMANRVSDTLYYHGVTEKHMIISIVPDEDKDAAFYIK